MKHSSALFMLLLLFAIGCSKEEFASAPRSSGFNADAVEFNQDLSCSNHTLVKPPVDVLYLVDNSSSANYIGNTIRQQIALTVQAVSNEFDYRIMVAPLLPDGGNDAFRPVITNNAAAMSSSVNVVPPDTSTFFGPPQGNNERGFERAYNLINQNRIGNGGLVFRSQAHTIVVLVSNGNDNETTHSLLGGGTQTNESAFQAAKQRFTTLRSNLQSQQLRFFSLVAHTTGCREYHLRGGNYIRMSQELYLAAGGTDQGARSTKDSYDLCQNEFALYSGVNSSIRQEILAHTYNRWQVSTSTAVNAIDPVDIVVQKISPNGATTAVPAGGANGFTCCDRGTFDTRVLPSVGEQKTGTFINLSGSARVTYPDCLLVRTRTPTEYYAYVVVPTAPRPNTIVVQRNGSTVPQSTTNGWSYVGYLENQNIKVTDQTGNTPGTPALNRTGYFIRLHGSAIYSSGDRINVYYTPAPI